MAYLDSPGLQHFWGRLKTLLDGKSDVGHGHDLAAIEGLDQALDDIELEIPTVHGDLDGREEPEQHPIAAIDGLQDNLDQRLLPIFLSNSEIDAIMNT